MSDQQNYTNIPDGDNRIQRWTVGLFSILVVLSFVLSYDALHQIAQSNGKSDWRSWLWPLLIDGALIIFSLYIVYSVRRGLRDARRYWWLVGVFTVLTILFNVLSGVQHIALRVVVAAVPPVVLFCTFETLMSMLRSTVQPDKHLTKPTVQVSEPDKSLTVQPVDSVQPVGVQPAQPSAQTDTDYRTMVYEALHGAHEDLSARKLADLIGCSPSTAGKYKREWSAGHSLNGHGRGLSNGV